MNILNRIIKWFKAELEGPDGKASHQKILVVYMKILFTFVVISSGIHKYDYQLEPRLTLDPQCIFRNNKPTIYVENIKGEVCI